MNTMTATVHTDRDQKTVTITIIAINIGGLAILLWLLTGNENDDQ
jgi:hypothetical protein